MIDEIQVENLALIRKASLEPARGLTVLTGETGAGKSALLSAMKLLMGERADKSAVRDGADALVVSGRFFVAAGQGDAESAIEMARDGTARDAKLGHAPEKDAMRGAAGGDASACDGTSEELVATRRVSADGRSRATLNGHMASAGELAERVAATIDLCGQHEHQQLMKPVSHVRLLDAWAGDSVAGARKAYEQAYDAAAAAQAELSRVRDAGAASSAKLEEARFVLKRIDAIDPQEGEYDELAVALAKAENAESLARAVDAAHQALAGDAGALDALDAAAGALEGAARYDDKLGEWAHSLREASYVLEDIAREARAYRDEVEFDAETLARQQERMSDLQGLLRAYGPRMQDVLAHRAEAADLVSLVDDASARERAAKKALDEAEAALACAAEALDKARAEAAPRFSRAVTAQMARLEMGGAELVCSVEPLARSAWTRGGASTVEFLFRPGAGMQARPLARIASGGEVSRVMLAVKVVLGEADGVDTLVFDEVDAGVGGSTAVALAEVLADLACTHQVIVVTHLAQVAVRGERHYVVRKVESPDGIPETDLCCLAADERPAEIARMLSGDVTETSLSHAKELLEGVKRK